MLTAKFKTSAACLVALLCGGPGLIWSQEPGPKKPWFDSGGLPIHYIVTGREDGEPVVLIHGFASSIEAQWTPVIDALKKDYKIIAMDIRGCGGSGKPHEPKKYGIEMVNDVVRLLDHLKIDKAHLVGYSMSAGTALCVTVNHGQRVRTLSVCGAGIVSFGSNTPPADIAKPEIPMNRLLTDLANALDRLAATGNRYKW